MNELFILSVIDVTKVKWFIINYDKINKTFYGYSNKARFTF